MYNIIHTFAKHKTCQDTLHEMSQIKYNYKCVYYKAEHILKYFCQAANTKCVRM